MKRPHVLSWAMTTLMAFWCAQAARSQAVEPKPVEGRIPWVYRYEDGQKQARESGKPLFVVFRCER
jgi:hypothetical protein